MYLKNIFKKTRKTRESGHYWVKWAGLYAETNVWRMGVYYADTGSWRVMNDVRSFYDTDFLEINEARIPFTTGRLHRSLWYWVSIIVNLLGFGYYTFYLLTHR